MKIALMCAVGAVSLAAGNSPARGANPTCERVGADYFEIDGMIDDWRSIRRYTAGGSNPDASFDLRCAYDDRNLYLSVNVRDDILLRGGSGKAGREDNVHIRIKVGRPAPVSLRAFPGVKGSKPVRQWNGKRIPKWLAVEDSLQANGYSVEVAIPLGKIAGFGRGTPALAAKIELEDGDVYGKKVETTVPLHGRLVFSDGKALYESFLSQTGLSNARIRLDQLDDVDDDAGAERVVWANNIVGVLSDRFSYLTLPVDRPSDVSYVHLIDLEGSGRAYIVACFRQRGNGGARDMVAIWRFSGAAFNRIFAFERRKLFGDRLLENDYTWEPRPKKRRGKKASGYDLVIEAGQVVGWDQNSFREAPAPDVSPILLPWGEQTSAVYRFESGVVAGGEPKP